MIARHIQFTVTHPHHTENPYLGPHIEAAIIRLKEILEPYTGVNEKGMLLKGQPSPEADTLVIHHEKMLNSLFIGWLVYDEPPDEENSSLLERFKGRCWLHEMDIFMIDEMRYAESRRVSSVVTWRRNGELYLREIPTR